MEKRRRVTEEDLLITEALIAESYNQLKQSVIQVPSRAYRLVGQTVREHPYESAATAVGAGAAVYGIINLMTARTCVQEPQERPRVTRQKDTGRPDLMQEMLPILIPLVAPYITDCIRNYIGEIRSEARDSHIRAE
jgi:hypothetical protein